jgi:carboxylate-amine ligase
MTMRTVGVEEELLLVDPGEGEPAPLGDAVVAEARSRRAADVTGSDEPVGHELKREQAETGSAPCTTLAELRAQLVRLRSGLAEAAAAQGAVAVAIGTSPLTSRPTTTDDRRYERITAEFGLLGEQALTCGQHVHVSVGSRDEGVAVLDSIRPWLAVLAALSANSPFWHGQDTGYASYRSMLWGQWPTAGPTEQFRDAAGYDQAVAELLATGTILDEGMIYFDARLSASYPTVEIRVADVCTDVDDAVLMAALSRALVETAARDWQAGRPAPAARLELLRAASWRAARSGTSDDLVDVFDRRPLPAWALIGRLAGLLTPALRDAGDDELAITGLGRLRARGTGAETQRASYRRRGSLRDVVHDAAARTVAR